MDKAAIHPDQSNQPCPCGSGQRYDDCCQPLHQGSQQALTAEQLMRSRYSAFALERADYLIKTSHPDYRQGLSIESLQQSFANNRWLGLEILSTEQGQATDSSGRVHFIATFNDHGQFGTLKENSRFEKLDGRWYYLDGNTEVANLKPERNAPCPCGSGKKFKKCCG